MTRAEAIEILKGIYDYSKNEGCIESTNVFKQAYEQLKYCEALDMAINSLQVDEMYALEEEHADEFISKSMIEAMGEELRTVRKGIKDENVLIGYNMAIAICNKYINREEKK